MAGTDNRSGLRGRLDSCPAQFLKEWAAWVRFGYLSLLDCKCFSFSAIVFQIALQIMPDDSLGILETLHPLWITGDG